jgi:FkbM family methyltransferase
MIIDVGANVGDWTRQVSNIFPDSSFLMIEAYDKHSFRLESMKTEKIDYEISLLSDSETETNFYVHRYNHFGTLETGNSMFREKTINYDDDKTLVKKMKSRTLDNLLAQKSIQEVDLLKMDVQGAELVVLDGAKKTLKKVEFCLLEVQIQEWNQGAPNTSDTIEYMKNEGFEVYDIVELGYDGSNYLIHMGCLFKRAVGIKYLSPEIER